MGRWRGEFKDTKIEQCRNWLELKWKSTEKIAFNEMEDRDKELKCFFPMAEISSLRRNWSQ